MFFSFCLLLFVLSMAPTCFHELGELPTVESVQSAINRRYDALYHDSGNGVLSPYVCSFCDEFILHEKDLNWVPFEKIKKAKHVLQWKSVLKMDQRIGRMESYYQLPSFSTSILRDQTWLSELALSPRGLVGKKEGRGNNKYGCSSCNTCKHGIENSYTPFYSIVNMNFVGNAPSCLTDLTYVELALISPVTSRGYCFTFNGGAHMNLKGTLAFMRVEEQKVGRAAMHLEAMGLTKHIVILLDGDMTERQKQKAKQQVRTEKVLAAVHWLAENHPRWKDVNLDELRQQLRDRTPVVVDQSNTVESENANIEDRELFSCYFPEGSATEKKGGFDDMNAFKAYVNEMEKNNFTVELKSNLNREYVNSDDASCFLESCLLQFPHAIGGFRERRLNKDGSYVQKVNATTYLQHLSLLSQTQFQEPMFQLMMYSYISKVRLLSKSRLQLRGTYTADALANRLNADDLSATLRSRRHGNRSGGTAASRSLLKAVDACSQALPHTNEAARRARADIESMQHHFGTGSIFLTVTFDDENSIILQVLSGEFIDPLSDDPSTMPDSVLEGKKAARRKLRIRFPGLSALNFEMMFDILCEEVIGWDKRRNCSTGKPGLFGLCVALSVAFEEQGRKTVHGHMTIWIRGFRKLQNRMFFGTKNQQIDAMNLLGEYHERLITTELLGDWLDKRTTFKHECTDAESGRLLPRVVDDQTLRHLRHKNGYQFEQGRFCYCLECGKIWTYEAMVTDYVTKVLKLQSPDLEERNLASAEGLKPKVPLARLQKEILAFQYDRNSRVEDCPTKCINALYQHHVSTHTNTCFKCKKKGGNKKKHTCGPKCECRFRLPDLPRRESRVEKMTEGRDWYQWDGGTRKQPQVAFLPKRDTFDLFQNECCRAISHSKFACNSNLAVVTDGPIAAYQTKYQTKPNQDEESAEYSHVEATIKKMEGRIHDDDKKEAVRRICRAAFAHNKTNIIGAPFASFLTRNESRFYNSHEFVFCPLNDLIRLASNLGVSGTARYNADGNMYFQNQALNYLCRHSDLEDVSVKEFYEEYQVTFISDKKKRKRGGDRTEWNFISDTGFFKHPSAPRRNNGSLGICKEGVRIREEPLLLKISQWQFVDTCKFDGILTTCPEDDINDAMEQYSRAVLVLLLPHRSNEDLCDANAPLKKRYTLKLREVWRQDEARIRRNQSPLIFTEANQRFLQNIQDSAHNSLRYKVPEDELARKTTPFHPDCDNPYDSDSDDDSEEDEADATYETFCDALDRDDIDDTDVTYLSRNLQGFTFNDIRNRGKKGCGYNDAIPIPARSQEVLALEETFVAFSDVTSNVHGGRSPTYEDDLSKPRAKKILEVLFTRSTTRQRDNVFKYNPTASVLDANGTVESIVSWAKAAKLDRIQRRAFETIISSFLLTFFDDAIDAETAEGELDLHERVKMRRAKLRLMRLKGGKTSQLVCLLHGPGGSGKSTVINLVTAYASEYCASIGHPFTDRTIVVTAMSGVAATLLHGETAHSALGLNRKNVIDDMINAWSDARLVIIDEISFATALDFKKIYKHCQDLKQKAWLPFGGLNIVFAGDYSQLEPPMSTAVYDEPEIPEFQNSLTTFIELDGTHRFQKDPLWGERLLRFREGRPTIEDIEFINAHCVVGDNREAPSHTQVACHTNRERDAVNTAIFENYCETYGSNHNQVFKGAIMVFMDDLRMTNSRNNYVPVTSNAVKKHFWMSCGEDSLSSPGRTRIDPCLKLYPNCPLMLTENKNVPNGQANGSRVFLRKVHIRSGERPMHIKLQCGTTIRAFRASQVKKISLRHETEDILPREFDVEDQEFKFIAKIDTDYGEVLKPGMKGRQFPIISNSATTGHKLQGYTAETLLVSNWHYGKNWAYVVLSRVKTMAGLYLLQPLSTKLDKYEMPQSMKRMIQGFKERINITFLEEAAYTAMISEENEAASST